MQIHKFESAGLGKAPFRVVGVYSLPSPSLAEVNPDAYNNALREMPKGYGVGSCAFCGTSLVHNYLIHSSDNRKFAVGCDCVTKTGDAGLEDEIKVLKRKERQAKRQVAQQAKREAAMRQREIEESAQRERNGGLTDYELQQQEVQKRRSHNIEVLAIYAESLRDGKGGFCDSVAETLADGRLPYGRGFDITVDILAKQQGRRGSKAYEAEAEKVRTVFDSLTPWT
jgi:hypothetical protein